VVGNEAPSRARRRGRGGGRPRGETGGSGIAVPFYGELSFTARINAPSTEAALGASLTVLAQTSGHVGLVEEDALRRVVIERDESLGEGRCE
jgi:hypothetical protein